MVCMHLREWGAVEVYGPCPTLVLCVPLFRYVILKRLVSLGRSKSGFAAVFRHHLRLQLLRAWRRPCNGVRTCFDGGENAFFGTAS